MLSTHHIRRRFERAASTFDSADFVHAATRDGLLRRIEPLLIDAQTIVDLGCATGAAARPLRKRFPKARLVGVDLAHNMLRAANTRKSFFARSSFVQADARALPFANESIDVVFSNQLLPWIANPDEVFVEIARVLKKGGVFAFATLGPDSLLEISRAWREIDDGLHVSRFPDMHNLGDGLVNAGLRDPVLDVDRLTVSYSGTDALLADLGAAGARNMLQGRTRTLTGKGKFQGMLTALASAMVDGKIALELELVFGHCWGAGPKMDPANYRIDASRIPLRGK
ncbi:MAG TPA: methyltransferase domain-containing protein [Woeseiaceae bacterium]|nr:methyltransferase domain-containing protein [Woeseiaceae bacterium]